MSGRNVQVMRLFALLNIIEGAPHGLTVSELEERLKERGFEATKRTLYRDMEALQASGFPLIERDKSVENGTRWALDRTTRLTQHLSFSPSELLALFLAKNMLGFLKDSPIYSDLLQAFSKVEDKLGSNARGYFDELRDEIFFDAGPRWGKGVDETVFNIVQSACVEKNRLKVTYHSAHSNEVKERVLGPECLYFANSAFYLLAKDFAGGDEIKTFSMARIRAAEMLADAYEPQAVDPSHFFQNSFGVYRTNEPPVDVVLEFAPKIASFIKEREWHKSQVCRDLEGGGVALKMSVALTPDLVQWVLSFGTDVTVREPVALQASLKKNAQLLLQRYGRSPE